MNIVDIIKTQDTWGRNQVKELPTYGTKISYETTENNG